MRPRWLSALLFALVVSALIAPAVHADQLEEDTRRIGKQLQCPVCSGAPVAESPSELAGQMRAVIRAKLEAGETDEQIIAYFVERYGDSVLMEPPRHGVGLLVWTAPIAVLLVGGALLWRVSQIWLRQRQAIALAVAAGPSQSSYRNGTATADDGAHLTPAERARAELEQFRRGA